MARPNNPAVEYKTYGPVAISQAKRLMSPSEFHNWYNQRVTVNRRINAQGSSETTGTGYQGTSLEDGDVMRWDEGNAEWLPSPNAGGGGTVDMQNHSHQSEENGDGGYVPLITE